MGKNRSHELSDAIEEMIAVGKLPPGTHLDETALAAQFEVSRTPIREALIQLSSMGLVVIRPRRGAVVAEVSARQLVEMFEMMAELEAMCCRLAARRMTPEDQERLLAAHEACRAACAAGDADDYYVKNEVFHQSIYAGSHNLFLQDQTRALHRRLRPYRRLQLRVRDRLAASLAEHQGVVDALLAADGELAATRIREHIMVQGQRFADLIASLSQIKAIAA